MRGLVRFRPLKPIFVEPFRAKDHNRLGVLLIFESGDLAAIGTVERICSSTLR